MLNVKLEPATSWLSFSFKTGDRGKQLAWQLATRKLALLERRAKTMSSVVFSVIVWIELIVLHFLRSEL